MLKEKINKIEFIDLHAQRQAAADKISQAIENVLQHGNYILGPEVKAFEEQLCAFTGASEAISCSNGTDALRLLLLAYHVGPGDAVFVPTFTFASTAEVVAEAKATPIFVDICPDTYNISLSSLQAALEQAKKNKLTPKGIIAVDLFGLPADYAALEIFAKAHGLWLISDAAQSFGGAIGDKNVGTLTTATTVSFFPSKPLACYGDGGAVFTTDPELGTLLRSLRNHGCGAHRYDFLHIGLNSRLDTLQAAILIEKLALFPQEAKRRQHIAELYTQLLKDAVNTPLVPKNYTHAWGVYTIRCANREQIAAQLQANQIPSNIYYRKPLHLQPAYEHFPRATSQLEVAEKACQEVLSLPMHPYLTDPQIEYISEIVTQACSN